MKHKIISLLLSLAMVMTSFTVPAFADDEVVEITSETVEDEAISEIEPEVIAEPETTEMEEIVEEGQEAIKEESPDEVVGEPDVEGEELEELQDGEDQYYYRDESDGEIDDYWIVPSIKIGDNTYYYCDIHNKYLNAAPDIDSDSSIDEIKRHSCDPGAEVSLGQIATATGLGVRYIPRQTDKYSLEKEKGTWELIFDNDQVGRVATDDNLIIKLNGTGNEINNRKDVDDSSLDVYGNLTIEGEGSLLVTVGNKSDGDKWRVDDVAIYADGDLTIKDGAKVSAQVRDDYPNDIDAINEYVQNAWYPKEIISWLKMKYSQRNPIESEACLKVEAGSELKVIKSPLDFDLDLHEINPGRYDEGQKLTTFPGLSDIFAKEAVIEGTIDAFSLSCKDVEFVGDATINLSGVYASDWIEDEAGDEIEVGSVVFNGAKWLGENVQYDTFGGISLYTTELFIKNATIGKNAINSYDYITANSIVVDGANTDTKIYAATETSNFKLLAGEVYIEDKEEYGCTLSGITDGETECTINVINGELTVKSSSSCSAIASRTEINLPAGYSIVEGSEKNSADSRIVRKSHGKPYIHICSDEACEEVAAAIANKEKVTIQIAGETIAENASGEGWTYDKASHTLTLENYDGTNDIDFSIADDEYEDGIPSKTSIYVCGDININVVGDNTITMTENEAEYNSAIYVDGDINMSGSGNIEIAYDEGYIDEAVRSIGKFVDDGVNIWQDDIAYEDIDESEGYGLIIATDDEVELKNVNMTLYAIDSYSTVLENANITGNTWIGYRNGVFGECDCSADYNVANKILVDNSELDCRKFAAKYVNVNSSDVKIIWESYPVDTLKIVKSKFEAANLYMPESNAYNRLMQVEDSDVKIIGDSCAFSNCKKVKFISGLLDVLAESDSPHWETRAFDPIPDFEIAPGYAMLINTNEHILIGKEDDSNTKHQVENNAVLDNIPTSKTPTVKPVYASVSDTDPINVKYVKGKVKGLSLAPSSTVDSVITINAGAKITLENFDTGVKKSGSTPARKSYNVYDKNAKTFGIIADSNGESAKKTSAFNSETPVLKTNSIAISKTGLLTTKKLAASKRASKGNATVKVKYLSPDNVEYRVTINICYPEYTKNTTKAAGNFVGATLLSTTSASFKDGEVVNDMVYNANLGYFENVNAKNGKRTVAPWKLAAKDKNGNLKKGTGTLVEYTGSDNVATFKLNNSDMNAVVWTVNGKVVKVSEELKLDGLAKVTLSEDRTTLKVAPLPGAKGNVKIITEIFGVKYSSSVKIANTAKKAYSFAKDGQVIFAGKK